MSKKLNYDEKVVMLKYNISRFDHYYASVNFKSSFLVLGNITVLGFILTNKEQVNEYIFYSHIFLIILSLIAVLLAIRPYLKTYTGNDSLVFFNDIANTQDGIYKHKIYWLSKYDYLDDLTKQSHILAQGLKKKFAYLNISTILFIMNIVLFLINMTLIVEFTNKVAK